ncbi:hypothetical protein N2152v2_009518 [Parachlorella kessleri]
MLTAGAAVGCPPAAVGPRVKEAEVTEETPEQNGCQRALPSFKQGPFELPPLPYALDALEPKMDKRTIDIHYNKHHAAYVNNLNGLVRDVPGMQNLSIEQVMLKAWKEGNTGVFNNAGQVLNHTFFWESMSPNGGGQPQGKLKDAIVRDFGSFEAFKDQFKSAGATQFGSGWAWLVLGKDGKLKVTKTPNAENPWVHGETPLLTMDVWEHAYYLLFQNRRPDYINGFIDKLCDWRRVEQRYEQATRSKL